MNTLTHHLRRRWSRITGALAIAIAITLAAFGSDPAAAACYLPGDHWVKHTSTLRSHWDWNGWTTCITIGNPNSCSRKYLVRYFVPTGGGVLAPDWGYTGVSETRTLKCYWYD